MKVINTTVKKITINTLASRNANLNHKNGRIGSQGTSYTTEMYSSCFTIFGLLFPYVNIVQSFNWKVVQLNINLNFEPLNNPKAH